MEQKSSPFIPILARKKQLESDLATYTDQTRPIKHLSDLTGQSHSFLTTLSKVCCSPLELHMIQFGDGPHELILRVPNMAAAINCIQRLNEEYGASELSIAALEPAAERSNGLLITIKQATKKRNKT